MQGGLVHKARSASLTDTPLNEQARFFVMASGGVNLCNSLVINNYKL